MPAQPQVFISYQRSDGELARLVRERLTASGVRTWMDQFDIPVGAYWPDEIDRGLASSDVVVGVLSPEAVESRNVKNEWDWAISNGKRLVLLQVQPCVIPHRYISINYLDATDGNLGRTLDALLQTLGIGVAGPAIETALFPTEQATPTRHRTIQPVLRRLKPLLVGRERETTELRGYLTDAIAGRGSIILVAGEAGIGKTTLTSWLAAEAEEHGVLVLTGGCYDLGTTPPYGPWVEIIRAWPLSDVVQIPEALRGGEAMAQLGSQAALFDLVGNFFAGATRVQPLVLLFEDLHWADQASLDLLRHVARLVGPLPLLLVLTYRDDEITRRHPLAPVLPLLARELTARRLHLHRLDDSAVRALVTARYHLPAPDVAPLVAYVQQLTEGNPFFAGEVLRALEEAGTLVRPGGTWELHDLERVQVPTLVRQVIDGRLTHLGDDARRLLEVAAVIGHEVPTDLWVEVSDTNDATLADILERAVDAHVVEELRGGERFRFTHALVREALYEGLVSLKRRALHRSIGEALARAPRPDPDAVADHFQQAGDARAGDWLIHAGDRAVRSYAWRGAVDRFDTALQYVTTPLDRGWLLLRIGRLTRWSNPRHGAAYLAEALALPEIADDPVLHAYVLADLGLLQCAGREITVGLANQEDGARLIDLLPHDHLATDERRTCWLMDDLFESVPAELVAEANPRRGVWVQFLGFAGDYRRTIAEGEAHIRQPDAISWQEPFHAIARGNADAGLAMAYALTGRPDDALRASQRSHAGFERVGHHGMTAWSTAFQLVELNLRYATTDLSERHRLAALSGSELKRASVATTWTFPIEVLLLEGQWMQAHDLLQDADEGFVRYPFSAAAWLAYNQSDITTAWRRIRTVLAHGPREEPGNSPFAWTIGLMGTAVQMCLTAGDLQPAREWVVAHERWLRWSGATVLWPDQLLLRAEVARAAEDIDAAVAHASASLDAARQPERPLQVLSAERLLGELQMQREEIAVGSGHLERALGLATACAAPYERALTLLALAELWIGIGHTDDARRLLGEARAICVPLGARPALGRLSALEVRLTGVSG